MVCGCKRIAGKEMEDYYLLHYKYERDGNTKFQFWKFRKLDKSH